MDQNLKRFMAMEFKSKATILNSKMVEVIAPDGELFQVVCPVGKYLDEEYRNYMLHLIEWIFDKSFSPDKERMINSIHRESAINGASIS